MYKVDKVVSGVYQVVNTKSSKRYIGSSMNIEKRFRIHVQQLKSGKHHSLLLQEAYKIFGESAFTVEVLEECSKDLLLIKEQEWLDKSDKSTLYNVSFTSTCGNIIENHPEKERLRREAGERLRLAPRADQRKERNSNWKGGWKSFCKCGNKMAIGATTCGGCRDRDKDKNPFFGKKHSEETIEKLRKAHKGKSRPESCKIVCIGDTEYKSLAYTAQVLGVVPATVLNRIKSKNYPDYKYKDQ
jgi:group I intron endonuclease